MNTAPGEGLHKAGPASLDIVIVLGGSLVQSVYSTISGITVRIADYDIGEPDENEAALLADAEARIAKGDMKVVW